MSQLRIYFSINPKKIYFSINRKIYFSLNKNDFFPENARRDFLSVFLLWISYLKLEVLRKTELGASGGQNSTVIFIICCIAVTFSSSCISKFFIAMAIGVSKVPLRHCHVYTYEWVRVETHVHLRGGLRGKTGKFFGATLLVYIEFFSINVFNKSETDLFLNKSFQ